MSQTLLMGIILVAIILAFLSNKLPLAVTSLAGAVIVGLFGFVEHKAVFTSFSSTSMVLMISMMIVGSSLFHTGLAQKIGNILYKFTGGSERSLILIAVLSGTLLSSVCSGTATLVTLFPIVTSLCIAAKVSVSKTYLPLAYGICFGSMLTVAASGMGTASSGLLEEAGYRAWGFLEPALVGAPLAIVGIFVLMLFGTKVLPESKVLPPMSKQENDSDKQTSTVKMWISGIVMIVIFVMMVISPEKLPLYMISSAGVVVLLLTKTITQKQMFDSISWSSVFLIAGMTTVANAVSNSGLGDVIANTILRYCGESSSPLVIIAVLLLTTALLTQFLSNNASILIMAPIGIALAESMGIEPYAYVMATFVGCLSCFCTPMATPALTYVMEPGGYKYLDFLKAGFLMQVVYFVVGMIVIPIVWL